MKKLFTLKLSLLFLLPALVAFKGQAQTIIAQQTDYSAGFSGFANHYDAMMGDTYYQGVGQTFKSLATGTLGTIQFYMWGTNYTGTTDIQIYSCSSTLTWGTLLGTKTGVPITADGWKTADVTALNIPVTAGNYYGFRLLPQGGIESNIGESGNASADAQAWWMPDNGTVYTDDGYNLAFKATMAVTLPVLLNSFTAQKQMNNVLLQWSTATEQNSRDFTVQHSADGNSWTNLATLSAAGFSNTIINYGYVHANPATGNNYYRLLQTDMDGKSSYTEVRMVQFSTGQPAFKVMSNPVTNGILQVQTSSAAVLSLYSADGRLVWKEQLGAGVQSINVSGLGKGIFMLKGMGTTVKVLVP